MRTAPGSEFEQSLRRSQGWYWVDADHIALDAAVKNEQVVCKLKAKLQHALRAQPVGASGNALENVLSQCTCKYCRKCEDDDDRKHMISFLPFASDVVYTHCHGNCDGAFIIHTAYQTAKI